MTTVAPYGSWPSPITADLLVAASVGLGGPLIDAGDLWWSELRPSEGGRVQLVRQPRHGPSADVLPEGRSARSRVHEYGGGAWTVADRTAYWVEWSDQRIHALEPAGHPVALTPPSPPGGEHRYADLVVGHGRRWLVCVRERHDTGGEPTNELVAVRTRTGGDEPDEPVVLWSGPDFVASPRLSPDGALLAWLQWDHPRMPWDGTELWVADVRGHGTGIPALAGARRVMGGPAEAVTQPRWSPTGVLHAVSDADGWWNLWAFAQPGSPSPGTATQRTHVTGELGQPQWVFGQSTWCFTTAGDVVGSWRFDGVDHLGLVPASGDGEVRWLDVPYTSVDGLAAGDGDVVAFLGASFRAEPAVVLLEDPAELTDATVTTGPGGGSLAAHLRVVRPPRDLGVDADWWSEPEHLAVPTADGRTTHAQLYRPHSPTHVGPEGTAPPLLVLTHGGPTAAARPLLDLRVQHWTSRGWAVVDVDYGGSTGYGRPYRRQLEGAWGIVDVADCEAVARWLVDAGEVDGDRLAIKGGSAGGYTTLCALVFGDTFRAGSSHYGIGDLEALARDTHKFESRYTDWLVGPYPEQRDRYVERSPIHHLDRLSTPMVVFQGLEDAVVPPGQAEAMVAAVRAKGVPVAYLAFEGEQHGFRRAETIRRVIEAEQYVLAKVFGIEPADDLDPVPIENG